MDESKKEEYQEWARFVTKKIRGDRFWEALYSSYAKDMIKNKAVFAEARKKFRVYKPLHAYLTIGKAKDKRVLFDLRYMGQSVGTISVKGDDVLLSVSDSQAKNSKTHFNYKSGSFINVDWKNSKDAKAFRAFFTEDGRGKPRQNEHRVESALFSEIGKTKSAGKNMCNITPVSYAGTRIHMKTAISACKSGKKGMITITEAGGEIDLLCRRSIKAGRGESRLVVVEIKDENKKDESFDIAMKQAISYAVFICELIHSTAGSSWMELWGMQNQKKTGFTIDCAVAMPKGESKPSYSGDKIEYISEDGSKDTIELHYMELNEVKTESVSFSYSFK